MKRRGFLAMLAGLPFVAVALKAECVAQVASVVTNTVKEFTATISDEWGHIHKMAIGMMLTVLNTGEVMYVTAIDVGGIRQAWAWPPINLLG